jgi:hypothetical protein
MELISMVAAKIHWSHPVGRVAIEAPAMVKF